MYVISVCSNDVSLAAFIKGLQEMSVCVLEWDGMDDQ